MWLIISIGVLWFRLLWWSLKSFTLTLNPRLRRTGWVSFCGLTLVCWFSCWRRLGTSGCFFLLKLDILAPQFGLFLYIWPTPRFWSSNEPAFWNKSIFLRHVSGHSPLASSLTSMLLVLDLPDPKRSEKNTFVSYGLFLTSFYLNLVVYFYFCWRGGVGRLCRRWLFEAFASKVLLFFWVNMNLGIFHLVFFLW